VGAAAQAFRLQGYDAAPATALRALYASLPPVRAAIRALEALLCDAWPRAPAHAPRALSHVLAAFVRVEAMALEVDSADIEEGGAGGKGGSHTGVAGTDAVELSASCGAERRLLCELQGFVRCVAGCEHGADICRGVIQLLLCRLPPGRILVQLQSVSAAV